MEVFRLYVMTYPYFFNHLTTDCDKSLFHYFWGGYKPAYDSRIVKLAHDLRFEIYNGDRRAYLSPTQACKAPIFS